MQEKQDKTIVHHGFSWNYPPGGQALDYQNILLNIANVSAGDRLGIHHGGTEDTESIYIFIQSGDDDWIKRNYPLSHVRSARATPLHLSSNQ